MARVTGALKQVMGSVPTVIKAGPNAGLRWSLTAAGRGYGSGTFESVRMGLLCGMLRPGECFWDIGAHKGYVSLLASRLVGPEGRVYAFEPSAENCAFLRRHIRWNRADNVTVVPAAVAGQDGRERFGGGSSIAFHLGEGRETVSVRSVPSLLQNDGLLPPTFIKIDAEWVSRR